MAFIRIAMMICAAMAAAKGVVVDGEQGGDFTAGINLARRHRKGKGKRRRVSRKLSFYRREGKLGPLFPRETLSSRV